MLVLCLAAIRLNNALGLASKGPNMTRRARASLTNLPLPHTRANESDVPLSINTSARCRRAESVASALKLENLFAFLHQRFDFEGCIVVQAILNF